MRGESFRFRAGMGQKHGGRKRAGSMAKTAEGVFERYWHRRAVAGWARQTDRAAGTDPARLDLLRGRARELRHQLDRLVLAADDRLETPPAEAAAPLPLGTDWVWRPDPWVGRLAVPGLASVAPGTGFGAAVALFHDCPHHELALRQRRNPPRPGLPPFALRLEVFGFEGSFLSLVIDLPDAAAQGLKLHHLLRLDLVAESERPLALFARLNLRHGPNVEQLVRQLSTRDGAAVVEFDLAYTRMNERRIEAIWLDLIFEAPAMNSITLRDLRLGRHPRARL